MKFAAPLQQTFEDGHAAITRKKAMMEVGALKYSTVMPMDRKSSEATFSLTPLGAASSPSGRKFGAVLGGWKFCVVFASEFYDELRGIEAEPVGNETVVSCHRDARLPADMADLSWIEQLECC